MLYLSAESPSGHSKWSRCRVFITQEGEQIYTTCGGVGYRESAYSRGAAAASQPGDASRQSSAQGTMVSGRQHADTLTGTPEAQRSGSDTRRQPEAFM